MKKVLIVTVVCFFVLLGKSFSQDIDDFSNITREAINNSQIGVIISADTWFSSDPNDLAPLVGTEWNFTYTLINVWTDTLTFGSTVQTLTDGSVALSVIDQYGDPGAVFYSDLIQGGRGFAAIIDDGQYNNFYSFTANGNTATGVYVYQEISSGYISDFHSMTGIKISGPTTTTSIKPTTTTTSVIPTTTSSIMPITTSTSSIMVTTTTTSIPVNNPPNIPSNPYPSHGATNAPSNVMLSWDGGDQDSGDNVTYDIYLGIGAEVGFYRTTTTGRCEANNLEPSTSYKWKVVAMDNHGGITEGQIWTFTTEKASSGCAAEKVLEDDLESLTLLRQFRDNVLAKSANGKAIIKLYYEKSPLIAELIEKNPALKEQCRTTLKALIPSIRKAIENKSDLRM